MPTTNVSTVKLTGDIWSTICKKAVSVE